MPGPGGGAQSGLGSGKLPYGMEEVGELGSLCALATGTLPLKIMEKQKPLTASIVAQ